MKKIINGKMYNTETAEEYGDDWNGCPTNDFNYSCTTLYKKKTGEFFLHGEGGALSKYSESCGNNSWTGGSKIIPITVDEAKEWTEEHLEADVYIELFGEVEEMSNYNQEQVAYILELYSIQLSKFECDGDLHQHAELVTRTFEKLWSVFEEGHGNYFTELCLDGDLVEEKLAEVLSECKKKL